MINSPKAVIFDCDGVMFDSRRANAHFYNHLLSRFGLPPLREDQVDAVHMLTSEESIDYIFQGTPHTADAQAYRLNMDYTPFIEDLVVEPGLVGLLKAMKPRAGLAVATNRSNTIGRVLDRFGLSAFFQIVVSCLDVQNPKPHPEQHALRCIETHGLACGDHEQPFLFSAPDRRNGRQAGWFQVGRQCDDPGHGDHRDRCPCNPHAHLSGSISFEPAGAKEHKEQNTAQQDE